ncbi:MAG: glycosyltransferase family 2 protein [Pirellulales bacterium]
MKAWKTSDFSPTRFPVNLDDSTGDERSYARNVLLQWQQEAGASSPGELPDAIDFLERLLGPSVCRRLGIYRLPENFLLSVVIPVFNEGPTIEEIIRRVRTCGIRCELIVVDDGSTDGTRELLEKYRGDGDVTLMFHARNQGKGAALRTGFMRAGGDVVVVQDADLEYDPADYSRLLQPIIENQADVVYGSRFAGGSHRVLYFWHSAGNRFLTLLSNVFTNLNLTDIETCYKMFRRELIQQIAPTLRENRFGIEPELTAKVARIPGVRIYERPINYSGRTYAQGKKIGWRDGLRALWCILRY